MLAHKADLSPSNKRVWIERGVPWEVVKNNNALVSLFEPCKNKKIIYAKGASSRNTTGNLDGEVEDDGKGIHEVDGFNETTSDVDDAGHSEREPHESEEGFDYSDDDEGTFTEHDVDDDRHSEGDPHESDSDEDTFTEHYRIIGLHPHKDVILLQTSNGVAAYHFRTSRMQNLGECLHHQHDCGIEAAFPYRSCYVDALPATKLPF
jgi:hypothetical protein